MASGEELDALVGRYQHESHRPRADQALFHLRKIASIVKPIMRRRNWRVGLLAEFFPTEERLLGLNTNRGQTIHLRLRYHRDHSLFLPLEEVVDTMLHELCHNVIGPHNEQFHALWDQLRDEHESLMRKGYTGEGFLGRGERLGGRRIPMNEARRKARAAADRRKVLSAGSGQRLGGTGILRGQDARAIIAAAVERRNRVERGCASGTDQGRQIAHNESIKREEVTTTVAEREDENEATIMQAYIDLIEEEESAKFGDNYIPPSAANPAGPRSLPPSANSTSKTRNLIDQQRNIEREISRHQQQQRRQEEEEQILQTNAIPAKRSISTTHSGPSHEQPLIDINSSDSDSGSDSDPEEALEPQAVPAAVAVAATPTEDTWTCEICTLINPINFLSCGACTVERPAIYSTSSPSSSPPPIPTSTKPNFSSSSSPYSLSSPSTSKVPTTRDPPNALKPRLSSHQAYQKFERERVAKIAARPIGWTCAGCGNFMEQEWWTCSSCGRMKTSS